MKRELNITSLVIAIALITSVTLTKNAYAYEDLVKCNYELPNYKLYGDYKKEITTLFISNLPNYADEVLYFSIINRWPESEICVVIYSTSRNSYEVMSIEAKEMLWDQYLDKYSSLEKENSMNISYDIHKTNLSKELSVSLNKIVVTALSMMKPKQQLTNKKTTDNHEDVIEGHTYTVELPHKNMCGIVSRVSAQSEKNQSWISIADGLYRYSKFSNTINYIEKEELLKGLKAILLEPKTESVQAK